MPTFIHKTGVVYQNATSKIVRKHFAQGQGFPPHNHPGEDVLISMLQGEVSGTIGESTVTLKAGDLVQFDGDLNVALTATTDGTDLIVYIAQKSS